MWLRDRWKYICCRDCVKRRVDNEVSCFDAFSRYGDAGAYDKHHRESRTTEKIDIDAVNIRDYTQDKHGRVDDYPYGGGAGMLMQAQPVYDAWKSVVDRIGYKPRTVYLTPQGPTFTQPMAKDLAQAKDLILLCGHYEGIDERVLEEIVTDYVSIGDYVLTGGELPRDGHGGCNLAYGTRGSYK